MRLLDLGLSLGLELVVDQLQVLDLDVEELADFYGELLVLGETSGDSARWMVLGILGLVV